MDRGLKVIMSLLGTMNLVKRASALGKCARRLSYVPLRVANLLRVGSASAGHGCRAPILEKVATATLRLSRWAIRPVGCFLLASSTACAAGWVSNPPNRPASGLCRILLYRLNHTPTPCIASAVRLYPGFSTPPAKMLDANKRLELIAKLIAYNGSPLTYFKTPLTNLAGRLQGAKDFVQAGGTLGIWHTRLLTYFGPDLEDPAPASDQTIALLSRKFWSPGCRAHTSMNYSQAFVVLPDLSGPDPRVKQGPASLLANTYPVLYKGKTLLVSEGLARDPLSPEKLSDYDQVIIYDTSVVVNGPGCWLEYYSNDRKSREK
jgi:hypothetical protein